MDSDLLFLREATRPHYEQGEPAVRVVDLFAGCGGLTVGLAEAARHFGFALEIPLAVEFDEAIAGVFQTNFTKANVECQPVESVIDGRLGESLSTRESRLVNETGVVHWLHGGPPCQGHSDLNNHTRRRDRRNAFYLRMARAAEILRPQVVVIENVPGVRHDKGGVVGKTRDYLDSLGYEVADHVVALELLGVPQRRRRHALIGLRGVDVDVDGVFDGLGGDTPQRDLSWAIGDLVGADCNALDVPSQVSDVNVERIAWLQAKPDRWNLPNSRRPVCHHGDHSYRSMYGKLAWNEPAQTITSGFGSMGQGRYVHPSEPRTLTPHEAARIQFFPDWFDFTAGGFETHRSVWAKMIANAVPPKLTMELGRVLLPGLDLDG